MYGQESMSHMNKHTLKSFVLPFKCILRKYVAHIT